MAGDKESEAFELIRLEAQGLLNKYELEKDVADALDRIVCLSRYKFNVTNSKCLED